MYVCMYVIVIDCSRPNIAPLSPGCVICSRYSVFGVLKALDVAVGHANERIQ